MLDHHSSITLRTTHGRSSSLNRIISLPAAGIFKNMFFLAWTPTFYFDYAIGSDYLILDSKNIARDRGIPYRAVGENGMTIITHGN